MNHRFAIVGYGGMGSWHVNNIRMSGCADLVGILDVDPAREALARRNGITVFESMDQLMCSDADCAVVATPNDTHVTIACDLLNAGRHVIVEKPAALNGAELERMYDAAHRAGRLLSPHQNRRWDLDFRVIKRLIEDNVLGDVFNVESRVHGSRGIPSAWRQERARGGGMVYDWGAHLVDQILVALGDRELLSVSCHLGHVHTTDVDDGFYLQMLFEGQCRAFIEVNTCNFISMPRFYVCGTTGTAMIGKWWEPCEVTKCLAWSETDVMPQERETGPSRTMSPRDDRTTRTFTIQKPAASSHTFIRNFCAAADGLESLVVREGQALRVMRVLDAAFESAASGRQVTPVSA